MKNNLTLVAALALLLGGCGKAAEPVTIERIEDARLSCWRVSDQPAYMPWNCKERK